MRKVTPQEQQAMLWGWARVLLPLLAVSFAPLFFDTWLNTQVRQLDYERGELMQRMRELHAEIGQLRTEAAAREQLDALAAAAPAMGLIEAAPGQIEVVHYDAEMDGVRPLPEPFVMAELGGKATLRRLGGFGIDPLGGLLPAGAASGEAEPAAAAEEAAGAPLPGPVRLEGLTPDLLLLDELPPAAAEPAPVEEAGTGLDRVAMLPR